MLLPKATKSARAQEGVNAHQGGPEWARIVDAGLLWIVSVKLMVELGRNFAADQLQDVVLPLDAMDWSM